MTTLKHDTAGFLVGDPLDLRKAVALLESIRADVHAMRQAMAASNVEKPGSRPSVAPVGSTEVDKGPVSTPRAAEPKGRNSPADAAVLAAVNRQIATMAAAAPGQAIVPTAVSEGSTLSNPPAVVKADGVAEVVNRQVATMAKAATPATPRGRDGQGRFVKGGGADGKSPAGGKPASDQPLPGVDGMAKRIALAVRDGISNSEEADPTVKAFNEVAEPLKRGYTTVFGGRDEKKKDGWFRRIWNELRGGRTEQTAYEKAAAKSLKAIENKPGGAVAGNGSVLPNLLPSLPKLPGAAPIFGGIGGMLKGAAKGALRRLPIIGALLGGIGAAADIFGSESDDTKTRREKDQTAGKAVGGFAGSIGGMAAGAKLGAMAGTLLGPVGTIVGGVVGGAAGLFFGDQAGQIIGEKVGGWTNDLREADIPGKLAGAWDSVVAGFASVTQSIEKAWGGFVDSAKSGWETVTNLFSSAYEGLKSLPVIGKAIQAAEDAGKKAAEVAGTAAGAAKAKAVEVGSNAVESAKQGAKYLAENTTVGKGATWLAEAGKGYNVIQRADGSLEKREGARNWRNFNPGNLEYGDFAKKHGAIGSDGRFAVFPDYESGRKAKEGLIFEGNGGRALKTAGDYGQGLGYKDKTLMQAISAYAPQEENNTKSYQAAALASVGGQNRKMGEYTPDERARIMDAMERMEGFKPGKVTSIVAPTITSPAAMAIPQVASISLPSLPSMPSAPQIPDAPEIQIPLSSGDSGRDVTVVAPPKEHGQDLSNRRLAHIVTGGYAGS